jgi:predicted GIY-YIG superfamily endonuclease
MLKCYAGEDTNFHKEFYYYTGMTNYFYRRIKSHLKKKVPSTARYGGKIIPVYVEKIIAENEDLERKYARQRELELKDYSPKKKEELIRHQNIQKELKDVFELSINEKAKL